MSPPAARDEDGVRRFVEQIAMLFADWGFPRMAGRVLLTLMVAEERGLTATELGDRLDASPAAISGAVRYLGQIGLAVREPVPGSRSDLHRLPDDAWYLSTATTTGLYAQIITAADDAVEPLGGPDTAAGVRVAEMRDFFTFVQREMAGLLDRWKQSRAEQIQPQSPARDQDQDPEQE
jgi:hypothetical protein